jgi:hypothetical protein
MVEGHACTDAGLGDDQSFEGKPLCKTQLRKAMRINWWKPEGAGNGWTHDAVECRTISHEVKYLHPEVKRGCA